MKKRSLLLLTLSAMFAALTFVVTFLFRIPIGTSGYIHLGDAFIYLAASILPTPFAVAAGAIGGGLSDYFLGYSAWVLPTVIIKALIVLSFTNKKDGFLCKRNIVALIIAAIITVVGYYFAEVILYGNWAAPLSYAWLNLLQAIGSAALYIFMAIALDKLNFKKNLA